MCLAADRGDHRDDVGRDLNDLLAVPSGCARVKMTLSKAEKTYIQSSILSNPPLRTDNRAPADYRPIALETAVVPLANGSAKVCIGRRGRGGYVQEAGGAGGGTEVVVGVKLEVAGTSKEEDEGGKIACTVSWWAFTHFIYDAFLFLFSSETNAVCSSPAAYPSLSLNALDELQSDLTSLLGSVLSHPSLRPNNLIIVPGSKAWAVKLDAVVLADNGNIIDCLMLACRAALWDTKVPRTKGVEYRASPKHGDQSDGGVDVDADEEPEGKGGFKTKVVSRATDFELTDYWDEGEILKGRESWPVCVTLNVVRVVLFCVGLFFLFSTPSLLTHLIHIRPVIERALSGCHAARRSLRAIADVRDVCVPEGETYPADFPIGRPRGVYHGSNKRPYQGWYPSLWFFIALS